MHNRSPAGPYLAFALLFVSMLPLRAEITSYSGATQITSLPYVISQPGTYYLSASLSVNLASGDAITVNASNVLLDFDGCTIRNTYGNATTAAGVQVAAALSNVAVQNGGLRGFATGIAMDPTATGGAHLIAHMHLLQSYGAGIVLSGNNSIVRACRVFQTNNPAGDSVGIAVNGTGQRVIDCDVSDVTGPGSTAAIVFYADNGLAQNNRVSQAASGIMMTATGKYRDNICADSVATAYAGGTDMGNN